MCLTKWGPPVPIKFDIVVIGLNTARICECACYSMRSKPLSTKGQLAVELEK